jgi:transcriptional regulator with XRE-family HTH domain
MSSRSLVASEAGIKLARQAFNKLDITRQVFSENLGLAASTVSLFFNRKRISRANFEEICTFLGLNWRDIAAPYSEEEEEIQELSPLDKLWQQIKILGSPTARMGLVLAKEDTLDWGWHSASNYEKSVRLGSRIQFEVNFETPGYLLLIQKDTSGQVWCFCPSCFAPQPQLETGKTRLPQEGSPIASFPIEGALGKEQILAVITQDAPNFKWLPQGNAEPLKLTENYLVELLNYVNASEDNQIFYTEYQIVE